MSTKEPLYQQFDLQCEHRHQTVWLPKDKRLKLGARVSLADSPHEWEVMTIYYTELPKSALNAQWKVGGLA